MSKLPESIKTIISPNEFTLKEKGSSFIALSSPADSEETALAFLNSARKKYYDATHHCYSYKLIDGTFKYSDDGEPGGTAGIRIYNVQNHFGLTGLITIVVRYFGGVKLGVGPLGKAYYEAALQGLKSSSKEERILHERVEISYTFDHSKTVHHLISKYNLIISENLFEPAPKMICLIPTAQRDLFMEELRKNFNANISVLIHTGNYQYLNRTKY